MAAPTKIPREVGSNKQAKFDKSDDNTDDDDDDMTDHVDVDFQAFTPTDSDFHGIKALLQQIFLKANIDLSEITNAIIAQNYIGNVLKTDAADSDDEGSDDTIFGITSVISVTEKRKTMASIDTIVSFVCDKCSADGNKMVEVLNDPGQRVGWVVCERFINIPPQAAVPMLDSLVSDMRKATAKQMPYEFDWYLLVCKCFRQMSSQDSQLYYTDAENEIFQKHASQIFTYSVAHEHDVVAADGCWEGGDDGMEALRTVILLDRNSFHAALREIKQVFPL